MHINRCTILPPSPPPSYFSECPVGPDRCCIPLSLLPSLSPLYISSSLRTFRNVLWVQTDAVSPSLSFPLSLPCISLLPSVSLGMPRGSRQMLYPSLSLPLLPLPIDQNVLWVQTDAVSPPLLPFLSLPLSPLYIPSSLRIFRNVARVQTDAVSPSLSFPFSLPCISLPPSVPLGMSRGSRQMLYPSLSLPLLPLPIDQNVLWVQTDAVSPSLSFPFSPPCIYPCFPP